MFFLVCFVLYIIHLIFTIFDYNYFEKKILYSYLFICVCVCAFSISKQSMIKVGTQNRFLQVPKQSLQKPSIAHTSSAVRFFIDNENNNDVSKNVETPS